MELAAGVWVLASFAATLLCSLWWRRSAFGIMMLLGVAYFIAVNVADERRKAPSRALLAGIPFAALYLLLCVRAAVRYIRKADVDLWFSAGMQGAYLLWERVRVEGAAAQRYWLFQALCAGAVGLGIAAQLAAMNFRPPPAPEKHPDLGRRATVREEGAYLSSLNNINDGSLAWPSEEMRKAAGENAWGTWRPRKGDSGTVVGIMTRQGGILIYIVEFKDDEGKARLAPFKEFSVKLSGP